MSDTMALIAADGINRRIMELERALAAEREARLAAEVRAEGLRAALERAAWLCDEYGHDCCRTWREANRLHPSGRPGPGEPDQARHHDETCIFFPLAAPPADPLPGLRELLAELEDADHDPEERDYEIKGEIADRLRAILSPLAPPRPEAP